MVSSGDISGEIFAKVFWGENLFHGKHIQYTKELFRLVAGPNSLQHWTVYLNSPAQETLPSCLYVFGDFISTLLHFISITRSFFSLHLYPLLLFFKLDAQVFMMAGGALQKGPKMNHWCRDVIFFSFRLAIDKKKNSSRDDRLMTTSECQLKQDREFSPRPFAVPLPLSESLGLIRSRGEGRDPSLSPTLPYLWWERNPDCASSGIPSSSYVLRGDETGYGWPSPLYTCRRGSHWVTNWIPLISRILFQRVWLLTKWDTGYGGGMKLADKRISLALKCFISYL